MGRKSGEGRTRCRPKTQQMRKHPRRPMSRRRNRKSLLPRLPKRLAAWLSVPELFGLGPGHVQMARELGMTPSELKAFSKLSPEHTWGLVLDEYIERRYRKKFSKDPPRDPRPV